MTDLEALENLCQEINQDNAMLHLTRYSSELYTHVVHDIAGYKGGVSSFSRNEYRSLSVPRLFFYASESREPIVTKNRREFRSEILERDILTLDYQRIGRILKERNIQFSDWHDHQCKIAPANRGYRYSVGGLDIVCIFKGSMQMTAINN